ncbi:MAG: hypothetical protein DLM53_03070 [Candidatus Eremiobacter antarcticus]|nr:M48 family metallopeptidase [Candidatus Eremiobacteraeota bacterium]MBC5808394.1 M48 family metallopeptidase [Candidatus Eremiobacteraeota bacterium]PZR63756.1 MAG: hypothetical protein DLM53_03070 [Candidatus Eremiobacter sp. RRmetagenome_bin22]
MIRFPPDLERLVDGLYPPQRQTLAVDLAHVHYLTYFAVVALELGLLSAFYFSGLATRLRRVVEAAIGAAWLRAAVYIVLLMVGLAVAEVPLSFFAGFTTPHRFGLSDESAARWFRDWTIGVGVSAVVSGFVGASLLRAMARLRSWPAIAALAAGPLLFFGSAIYPLYVAPLFNRYTPMPPTPLSREILAFAKEQGLDASVLYEYDMSAQTREANAYVAGLGKTERIAVADTLLRALPRPEVMYVVAHEIGHYKLGHLWIGTFEGWFGAAAAVFWVWLAASWLRRDTRRCGSIADPAAVPIILAMLVLFQLLTAPLSNALSRNIEQAADAFAAEHTRLGAAGVRAFARLASQDLQVLHPSRLAVWYFYSHPPTDQRIAFAASRTRSVVRPGASGTIGTSAPSPEP